MDTILKRPSQTPTAFIVLEAPSHRKRSRIPHHPFSNLLHGSPLLTARHRLLRLNSFRALFDFAFFLIIVVIILNIVFGIIIDTFAQLRDQKHSIEEDTRKYCLICGQAANLFDRSVEGGFSQHVAEAHNMWQYLYFMVHLRHKSEDEYTGQVGADFIRRLAAPALYGISKNLHPH